MIEMDTRRGVGHGLSRATAVQCCKRIESLGLGPVQLQPHPEGVPNRYVLAVRIGPWHRLVASEAALRALLEERQACYF